MRNSSISRKAQRTTLGALGKSQRVQLKNRQFIGFTKIADSICVLYCEDSDEKKMLCTAITDNSAFSVSEIRSLETSEELRRFMNPIWRNYMVRSFDDFKMEDHIARAEWEVSSAMNSLDQLRKRKDEIYGKLITKLQSCLKKLPKGNDTLVSSIEKLLKEATE